MRRSRRRRSRSVIRPATGGRRSNVTTAAAPSSSVSYRQKPYRAVEPRKRRNPLKRIQSVDRRIAKHAAGALRGTIKRLLSASLPLSGGEPSRRAQHLADSASSFFRRKNRGKEGPCIQKPDSSIAGKFAAARRSAGREGYKRSREERLKRFRKWCE